MSIRIIESGRTIVSGLLFYVVGCLALVAQPVQFQKTYGGSAVDESYGMCHTSDGGYALVGKTNSFGAGNFDVYLVKVDALGNEEWSRTIGDANQNNGRAIWQCSDGGYIIAGDTWDPAVPGAFLEIWIVRTDALGNVEWSRTMQSSQGNSGFDFAQDVKQTSSGDYVVTGYTSSVGAGGNDVFFLRINATGTMSWFTSYGGSGDDRGYEIEEGLNGEFLIAGYTTSYGAGGKDVLLIGTLAFGGLSFAKTYGGFISPSRQDDAAFTLEPIFTNGGGIRSFMLAGYTDVFSFSNRDVFVLDVHPQTGGVISAAVVDFNNYIVDEAYDLKQDGTLDFVVTGKVTAAASSNDAFFLRLSVNHATLSAARVYGTVSGSNAEAGEAIAVTDGGFAIAGHANAFTGSGTKEMYLIRTDNVGLSGCHELNPARDFKRVTVTAVDCQPDLSTLAHHTDGPAQQSCAATVTAVECYSADPAQQAGSIFDRSIGHCNVDDAYAADQIDGGDFVLAGISNNQATITRLDAAGTVVSHNQYQFQWQGLNSFAGGFYGINRTVDGGYVVCGFANFDFFNPNVQMVMLKCFANGSIDWVRVFGSSNASEVAMAVKQTVDGGYVVTGYYNNILFNPGLGEEYLQVVKLSSSAALQWAYSYDYAQEINMQRGFDIIETSDCGYAVAGRLERDEDNVHTLALLLDNTGGISSSNTYLITTDIAKYDNLRPAICQSIDNEFRLVDFSDNPSSADNILLVALSQAGVTQWQREIGAGVIQDDEYPTAIEQIASGEFLVTYNSAINGGGLFTVDNAFGTSQMRYYDQRNFVVQDAFESSNGGFLAVGQTSNRGVNGDILAVHTDVNRQVNVCDGSVSMFNLAHESELETALVKFPAAELSEATADATPLTYVQLACQETNYQCKQGSEGSTGEAAHLLRPSANALFKLFPNPISAGESFQLFVDPAIQGECAITVRTVLGSLIWQGSLASERNIVIDTEGWASGSYALSVTAGSRTESQLITVTR